MKIVIGQNAYNHSLCDCHTCGEQFWLGEVEITLLDQEGKSTQMCQNCLATAILRDMAEGPENAEEERRKFLKFLPV